MREEESRRLPGARAGRPRAITGAAGPAVTASGIGDRLTADDAASIAGRGLDGGKMLIRIDPEEPEDPATAGTLEGCAHAVSDLAGHERMAMIEPFIAHRAPGAPGPGAAVAAWRQALQLPTVRGLVIGRSLLCPPDGDVAGAAGAAVEPRP
jgi:hypothetical protein